MKAVLFNSFEAAQALQAIVDAALNYPVHNTDVDGDTDASTTQHISYIKQHPSNSSVWAYIVWNGMFDVIPPEFLIVYLANNEWFPVRSP